LLARPRRPVRRHNARFHSWSTPHPRHQYSSTGARIALVLSRAKGAWLVTGSVITSTGTQYELGSAINSCAGSASSISGIGVSLLGTSPRSPDASAGSRKSRMKCQSSSPESWTLETEKKLQRPRKLGRAAAQHTFLRVQWQGGCLARCGIGMKVGGGWQFVRVISLTPVVSKESRAFLPPTFFRFS